MKLKFLYLFIFVLFVTSYENLSVWFPAQGGLPNKVITFDGGVYETRNQVEIDYLKSLSEFNTVYFEE